MSNLGLYQWFATTAKKVGDPAKLIGMFISGGAIIGGAVNTPGARPLVLNCKRKMNKK